MLTIVSTLQSAVGNVVDLGATAGDALIITSTGAAISTGGAGNAAGDMFRTAGHFHALKKRVIIRRVVSRPPAAHRCVRS